MHTELPPSNPEVQYEKTDAHPRPLYHFLFWICVTCVFSALFSWGVFKWLERWREGGSTAAVMTLPQDGPGAAQPPSPRLQTREPLDLAVFKKQEADILSSYGPVDNEKGLFRIPIDAAMKLALERGFPVADQPGPEPLASPSAPAAAAKPAVRRPARSTQQ